MQGSTCPPHWMERGSNTRTRKGPQLIAANVMYLSHKDGKSETGCGDIRGMRRGQSHLERDTTGERSHDYFLTS